MAAIPNGLFGVIARKNGASAGGTPTFVKSVGTREVTHTSTTTAVTLSAALTSGNMSVLIISSSLDVTSIADTGGNTYSEAIEYTATSPNLRIWYSLTTTGLAISDTVTVTFAANNYSNRVIEVVEIENVTALDTQASNAAYTSSILATATPTATSVMVGMMARAGSYTIDAANNSTLLTSQTATATDAQTFYKNETATVSTSWGIDLASAAGVTIAVAVFK